MSDNAKQTPGALGDADAAGAAGATAAGRGRVPDENAHREQRNRAFKDVFWYGLARLALFLVVFAVLVGVIVLFEIQIPLAILAVLALIVAMPASVFLFPTLRTRANEGVSVWDANRREHKKYVREQLAQRETE
ncbi:DUF4229 domain-containing protein [Corynebacterium sp. NPDC060344]|uniref:DUF4229 domain-containing protein n=1 Tax=Corynebacterium sp. NPDC060344 TaxID=3347101 RepID=UPI003665108E